MRFIWNHGFAILARWSAGASLLWITVAVLAASERKTDAAAEIAELRRQVAYHDELYHRQAAPEITDAAYDQLKRNLAALERRFPNAANSSPRLPGISDDRSGLFQAVRHRERMLSLDKAYDENELRAFHRRTAKSLGRDDVAYVIEPKVDGLAISVTYEGGQLTRALTRGDGTTGEDVTTNVLKIAGIPRQLATDHPPAIIELRGEVYVRFAEFARVNAEREGANETPFAHPRSLAAGTLRQSNAEEIARRGLRIVFFGVGACEPQTALPDTHRGILGLMKTWGLPTVEPSWIAYGGNELVRAVEACGQARAGLAFPTDGAVVKLALMVAQRELGAGEHSPRWAVAYKFPPPRVETQVVAITIQVGRTGVLTPVAELAPVQISGSMVARATLHNRNEIVRKDVRVGDFVFVEKAGDVIPAISGVNHARRPSDARPFEFPQACPACQSAVQLTATVAAVRCPNAECPAQLTRRLEHFVSKECVDITGFGPALVATLVEKGLLRDISDIYRLRRETLITVGLMTEKSADALVGAIQSSRNAELWRFLYGLGLPQVGAAKSRELARRYGSLEVFAATEPSGRELCERLLAAGVRLETTNTAPTLAGKTFVLTGTLPSFTRPQATTLIEAAGGRVASSVSRVTSFLVAGNEAGAKLDHATKLGIRVIDETELRRLLAGTEP